MFNSVYTPISDLYGFIQSDKAGLQGGELNKQLYSLAIVFLQFGNVGSSFSKACQIICVRPILISIKNRQENS